MRKFKVAEDVANTKTGRCIYSTVYVLLYYNHTITLRSSSNCVNFNSFIMFLLDCITLKASKALRTGSRKATISLVAAEDYCILENKAAIEFERKSKNYFQVKGCNVKMEITVV